MSYQDELDALERRKQEILKRQDRTRILLERLRAPGDFTQDDVELLEAYCRDRLHGED